MTGTDAFAIVRAVHQAATLLVFGQLMFVLVVARPASRGDGVSMRAFERRMRRIAGSALAVSLLAAIAWLGLEASRMSGLSLADAAGGEVLSTVLLQTLFGKVWISRIVLGTALGAALWTGRRRAIAGARLAGKLELVLAALYLGTLSLVGHSVGGTGLARDGRVGFDAVHLLAAGAWLGALPGLALLLALAWRAQIERMFVVAAAATRRFSALGICCVGLLVASGIANAWYLVGSPMALGDTRFGRLLLAKLVLFAAMVALAAHNRLRVSPRVEMHGPAALRSLVRNARTEIALGIAVVAVVGWLGISSPADHMRPMPVLATASPGDAVAHPARAGMP
ncbi:MAG TPA: copper homeostasis membrane protein CopD [Casimicrobiaceae bacterium]|nr:copper homeostasis membrane protein CopD [Casimicrobiaceae bacterium]